MYVDYRVKAEPELLSTLRRIGYEGFGTEFCEGYEEVLRMAEAASLKPFFLVRPKVRVPSGIGHMALRVVKPREARKGFDLLELGEGVEGIREAYEFCRRIGYTGFRVEVRVDRLRKLKGRELIENLRELVKLFGLLKDRGIGVAFSSGARDWRELVSVRSMKQLEKYLTGEFVLKLKARGKRRYIHLVGDGSLGELKGRMLELFGSLAYGLLDARAVRLEDGFALRCPHHHLDAWLLCLALSDSRLVSLGVSGTLRGLRD